MQCPACRRENQEGLPFCIYCGSALTNRPDQVPPPPTSDDLTALDFLLQDLPRLAGSIGVSPQLVHDVALKKETALEYVHQEHLSGTALSTDSAGAQKSAIKYLPFGATRSSAGTLGTDRKFTGQRLDGTGLYFYQAPSLSLKSLALRNAFLTVTRFHNGRMDDPILGRFIQPDPVVPDLANPQSLNRYSYVKNNPLTYTDPDGHWGLAALLGISNPWLLLGYGAAEACYYYCDDVARALQDIHLPNILRS